MNIALLLRVLLLIAVFAYPLFAPESSSGANGVNPGDLFFAGIVFFGFATVAFFGGCMRVILSQRRDFPRPSLRAPIFSKRSPVQFLWYGGLLFISSGVGVVATNVFHALSFDGVLMIAGGLGLYTGCILTLKINYRRFLGHSKRRTEQGEAGQPPLAALSSNITRNLNPNPASHARPR
jgi:hypothetical protein